MKKKINTAMLPGFPEFLPREQMAFNRMLATIRGVYERFGFIPLETPVIERPEVLKAKEDGETSKQIYMLEHPGMAMRFDHTVPLARYVAEHQRDLVFPFRRHAIGKVYRGERPQKGRLREFYQCDIDVIGNGSLDLAHDADVLAVVSAAFDALKIGEVTIRLSNRTVLQGLASSIGLADKVTDILRTVDKIDKVKREEIERLLGELGCDAEAVEAILRVVSVKGAPADAVAALRAIGVSDDTFAEGVAEIETVTNLAFEFGVPASRLVVDLSITRGLDYYTGTVCETNLVACPELGSICSGGRFDNLASAYTDAALPGVGISIGLSRLFAQLKEAGLVKLDAATPTKVLVIPMLADRSVPLSVAGTLRAAGIPTEVFLENKKPGAKFAYADKQGIPVTVVIGEDEIAKGVCAIKNLATKEQIEVPQAEVVAKVTEILGSL
jgi:histidyl-tRNA synthetase